MNLHVLDLCSGQIFHPFIPYCSYGLELGSSPHSFLLWEAKRYNTEHRLLPSYLFFKRKHMALLCMLEQECKEWCPMKAGEIVFHTSVYPDPSESSTCLQLHYTGMSRMICECWHQEPPLFFAEATDKNRMNVTHQMFKHGHSLPFRFWRSSITWIHFGVNFAAGTSSFMMKQIVFSRYLDCYSVIVKNQFPQLFSTLHFTINHWGSSLLLQELKHDIYPKTIW